MAAVTTAVAAGVGAAAAVGSSVYGAVQASEAQDAADAQAASAEDKHRQAMREFENLKSQIPTIESQLYELERFRQVANLTPELEEAILQRESELKNIAVDPQYKAAQLSALRKYEEMAASDQLTPVQRSELEKIKSEINNFEKANREAILQAAAQRGTLSGGQTMTAQLMAQQSGANRASQMGFDVAAKGFDQQMEAIGQASNLATQLRGQEFGEQRDIAAAQDLVNRFDTQQKTDVQRANVDRKNIAQQYNKGMQQDVANMNTGLSHEESRNKAAQQQQLFENKLRIASGKAGQLGQAANQQAQIAATAQANANNQMSSAMGGIAKAGAGLASYGIQNWGGSGGIDVPSTSQPGYNYQGTQIFNKKTGKWENTGY